MKNGVYSISYIVYRIKELSNYIDEMNDTEYKDFISEFSEAEQEQIGALFRPTKKQKKELFKQFKF